MARTIGIYSALLVAFVAMIAVVLHFGPPDLHVPDLGKSAGLLDSQATSQRSPLSEVLLQVLVIVIAARLVGVLFTKMAQPAVIGEMAVGIALGPTVLGSLFPSSRGPLKAINIR